MKDNKHPHGLQVAAGSGRNTSQQSASEQIARGRKYRDGGHSWHLPPSNEEFTRLRRQAADLDQQLSEERALLDARLEKLLETIAHNPQAVRRALGLCEECPMCERYRNDR